jgi:hypothetical protein
VVKSFRLLLPIRVYVWGAARVIQDLGQVEVNQPWYAIPSLDHVFMFEVMVVVKRVFVEKNK